MGCAHSRGRGTAYHYAVPINTPDSVQGESQTYRAAEFKNALQPTVASDPSVKTVKDIYTRAFKLYKNHPYLGTREHNPDGSFGLYDFKTYGQVQDCATKLGSGIVNLELTKTVNDYMNIDIDFCVIWSKNREEWIVTDIACSLYRLSLVPVYDTLGPDTITFIFSQTNATTIFLSNDHINAIIREAPRCKTLKNVVTFENFTEEQRSKAEAAGLKMYTFQEVQANGEANKQEYKTVTADDIYTVNYTSGTTGLPKGVMISHRNQVASSAGVANREDLGLTPHDSYLSYLPLAHTMERTATLTLTITGVTIGFYNGDVQKIKEDLQEFKPTVFASVPRLYTRFYEKMQEGVNKLSGMKKSLATKAVEAKVDNLLKHGALQHGIYDSLVFNKMKNALGGRLRIMISGSAPIEPAVQNFLRIALGVPMVEGYGQTETCAASFVSRADVLSIGHVGSPLGCIEFKVVDVAEMNYTSQDRDAHGALTPRGEICLRGPSVFSGYYKDPERTAETLDKDGWVHTGDIGRINPDGSLSIIDRKKNIFKLAQGEYVASEKVENAYSTSKYVAEVFLYGDSLKAYTVAIAVPHKGAIVALGEELGLHGKSFEELCQTKEIKAKVLEDMTAKGQALKINSFELAKQLYLEPVSFSEKELLTPTFKLMRHQAKTHYQKVLDKLYQLPL